jgi:hypothetical protein
MTRVALVAASVLCAGSAWAQSAYVGGAVAAEIVRTTTTRSGDTIFDAGSGEAFGGAIRAGTFLTEHVGVEIEYFRPGRIESEGGGGFYPVDVSFGAFPGGITGSAIAPIISQTTHVRTSTTSALLTARQPIGRGIELVYLGGVGFSRVVRETEFGFPRLAGPLTPRPQGSYTTRTTQYGTGPVVGVEVRGALTDHAQVVGGLRLHALGQSLVDGWMLRPNVGLAWKF